MGNDLEIVVVAISLSMVLLGTVIGEDGPLTRKVVLVGQAGAFALAVAYGLWFVALFPLILSAFYWRRHG